jgi:hypothetical protein
LGGCGFGVVFWWKIGIPAVIVKKWHRKCECGAVIVRILAAFGGFVRACVGGCFFPGLAKIRRGFEDLMIFMMRC